MRYDAFISYSHEADGDLAAALQVGLERLSKPWWRRAPFLTVFRDETTFSAGSDLGRKIEEALDASDNLVVLLSPQAARSPWVDEEVRYWLDHKTIETMLFVVTDWPEGTAGTGEAADSNLREFDWDGPDVPPALRGRIDEPLAVDMRWGRGSERLTLADPTFQDDVAEIAAAIRGENKDALVGALVGMRTRARILTGTIAIAGGVLIAAFAVAALGFLAANEQRDAAQQDAATAQSEAEAAVELRDAAQQDAATAQSQAAQAEADRAEAEQQRVAAEQAADAAAQLQLEAEEAAREAGDIAAARRLAGQALARMSTELDLATLLAIESLRIATTAEGIDALLTSLETEPGFTDTRFATQVPQTIALSPTGEALMATGRDDVMYWGPREGTPTVFSDRFFADSGGSEGSAFLSDGIAAFSSAASPPGSVELWDLIDGEHLSRLDGASGGLTVAGDLGRGDEPVRVAAWVHTDLFQNSDRVLMWTVTERCVRGDTPCAVSSFPTGTEAENNISVLSRDGTKLATRWLADQVRIWDVTTGGALLTIPTGAVNPGAAAFNPRGDLLVVAVGSTLQIRSALNGASIRAPLSVEGSIVAVAFSPDGTFVAAGTDRSRIHVWDVATQREIGRPRAMPGGSVNTIVFTPDSDALWASSSATEDIRRWMVETVVAAGLQLEVGDARALAADPTGRIVAVARTGAGADYGFEIRDGADGEILTEVANAHDDHIVDFAFSSDGSLLATAGLDAVVNVWDTTTWRATGPPLTGHLFAIEASSGRTYAEFGPGDEQLVSAGAQGEVKVWDVASHGLLSEVSLVEGQDASSIALSPDGSILAIGGVGTVELRDARTLGLIAPPLETVTPPGAPSRLSVTGVAWGADGKRLAASTSSAGALFLWDVTTFELVTLIPTGVSWDVAFSPDGRFFAAAMFDGSVLLFDATTGARIGLPVSSHDGAAVDLEFSPDGNALYSTDGQTLTIMSLEVDTWIEIACDRTDRSMTADEWSIYFPGEEYSSTCPEQA